jgi:hypothetical protein
MRAMGKVLATLALFVVATLAYLLAPLAALGVAALAYVVYTRSASLKRASGKPRGRRPAGPAPSLNSGFGSGIRR